MKKSDSLRDTIYFEVLRVFTWPALMAIPFECDKDIPQLKLDMAFQFANTRYGLFTKSKYFSIKCFIT